MAEPGCGPQEVRIGVVVDIPEPWASDLRRARASYNDPLAATVPAHVTIIPPTTVDRERLDVLGEHLSACCAAARAFRMRLRGTGTFRPVSPVVFVALAEGISGCEQLHRALRSGCLDRPAPFPYHPHVTVAQEVEEKDLDRAFKELADFDEVFEVTSLALYFQSDDGAWVRVRSFPLGAAAVDDGSRLPDSGAPSN
jgi:2'-5' RNA ligase